MAQELSLGFDFRTRRFKDARRGLEAFAKDIGERFDGVPEVVSRELRLHLEDLMQALELRHSNPWPQGTGTKTLSKRSGFMLEAMRESLKVEGGTIPTIAGYMSVPGTRKIHEHGGVLKPKKAKYLTIPLPAALNSNGTPKRPSASAWKDTFVIKSKAGNLLICQKQGARLVPLYVLKKSVTIPPRLGMRETAEAGQTILSDRMATAILDKLRGK